MKFFVKSIDASGKIQTTEVEAKDRSALYADMRSRSEHFISATEKGDLSFGAIFISLNKFVGRVKADEKINFARNLSAMLKAGLSISKSLSILERQTKNATFKKVIISLNEEIAKGGTLSSGLLKNSSIFSPLFISMVRSGEESGGLSDSLNVIAVQMERNNSLVKKVRGAMIYPAIILSVMLIIGIVMLIYVIPTLTTTFKELKVPLPASTRAIISVSDFLTNHTLLFIVALIGVISASFFGSKIPAVKHSFDFFVIRIPIVGNIVKEVYAARVARTLSSLLSAGVEVVSALLIARDVVQNSFYKETLVEAGETVKKGKPMSLVFLANSKLYPVLVGEMMAVGEETGKLSEMLGRLAEFYEEEVEQKTKNMSTIIEPFLMVFIGAAVGFFAVAMISPTYSVLNTI